MNVANPWRTTPRLSVALFLSAVFCVIAIIGIAADILDMGNEQPIRFGIGVVATGLFAVAYAFAGISLRGKFWIAFFPLIASQLFLMSLAASWFPDPPRSAQPSIAEIKHMHRRLTFDAFAIISAVALGYSGFVAVFISEGRRHIRAHTEKAVLDGEMAAAREVQQMILPEAGESFPGYAVESVYLPAQQVGGDFFQILPVGKSGLLIVLGDVAGKGLPAAMLVSMLVGSIRVLAEDTHDPALILRKLQDRLMRRGTLVFVLQCHHFMYTAFVAATTFKLGVEKNPRHRVGFFRFCVALAEGQDVGVIVLTGQEDFVEVYCECGPGALDFVSRHGHTHAGGTYQKPAFGPARNHFMRYARGEIRIVARIGIVCSQIRYLMALSHERVLQMLFQVEPRVVGADSDSHGKLQV